MMDITRPAILNQGFSANNAGHTFWNHRSLFTWRLAAVGGTSAAVAGTVKGATTPLDLARLAMYGLSNPTTERRS